jgi:hypothetical protein
MMDSIAATGRPQESKAMNFRLRWIAILATAFGACAATAAPVSGPGFTSADEGRAMLDVLEGKAAAAAVTTNLYDAVMAARETAWADNQRMLVVPATLRIHAMAPGKPGALVTVGEPSPEVAALLRAK